MEGYYQIAGLTVQMNTFGRTLKQAEPYRMSESAKADVVIHADWQALKLRQSHLDADDCEYLCTGGSFYRQLIGYGGMMLHASAVVMDGRAYLFSAPCGTGKSTHTQLWLQCFGYKARILNDDKPALREIGGTWYAYGTPWSGKHDISINMGVPLAGIAIIERSPQNEILPFYGAKAAQNILEQIARPENPALREKMMDLLADLTQKIPIWLLRCNMEPEAARMAYHAMSKERES